MREGTFLGTLPSGRRIVTFPSDTPPPHSQDSPLLVCRDRRDEQGSIVEVPPGYTSAGPGSLLEGGRVKEGVGRGKIRQKNDDGGLRT